MIRLEIPDQELFNDDTNEFFTVKGAVIELEHSLIALSKWESKWQVHYLNNAELTQEQQIDYVRCMTITKGVNPELYLALPADIRMKIREYIDYPMTATTVSSLKKDNQHAKGPKYITSELIYAMMVMHGIPFECEKWHLNRLLTLIKCCDTLSSGGGGKMSRKEVMEFNKMQNEARRAKYKH